MWLHFDFGVISWLYNPSAFPQIKKQTSGLALEFWLLIFTPLWTTSTLDPRLSQSSLFYSYVSASHKREGNGINICNKIMQWMHPTHFKSGYQFLNLNYLSSICISWISLILCNIQSHNLKWFCQNLAYLHQNILKALTLNKILRPCCNQLTELLDLKLVYQNFS